MNTLIKTTLSAMALGLCFSAAHAEVVDKNPPPPNYPESCKELCGQASIPITLEVPRKCELSDVSGSIVLNSTTGAGTGGFKVGANAPYNLLVTTDNQTSSSASAVKFGLNSIPTTVTTTRGATTIGLGVLKTNEPMALTTPNDYNITIQAGGSWGVSKPAGTYTDKYNIAVYF